MQGLAERPALQALVPRPLAGAAVLDAGCGSGAQAAWLLDQGADVIGIDLSPRMVEEAAGRCGGRGRFMAADMSRPLPLEPQLVQQFLPLRRSPSWPSRTLAWMLANSHPQPA